MPLDLTDRWNAYTEPFEIIRYALWCLFQSLWSGMRSGARDHAFAEFYSDIGVHFARFEEETPVPRLVAQADGVTLELGPGSGNQLSRFDAQSVTRVYGLEPNPNFIPVLETKVQHYPDLGRVYVLVNAALGDQTTLRSHGIMEGSLDTVVCMQVLCSVPDPAAAARQIHRLLKPGGQLLFWEHQTSRDALTRLAQRAWSLIWTPLIGGCCLHREIEKAVIDAGPWEVVELDHDGDQSKGQRYHLLPRTWGRLIKRDA